MTMGQFAPSIYGEIHGETSLVEFEGSRQFGTDSYNIHESAEGEFLEAGAEAKFEYGTFDNENGMREKRTTAKAGAEAYVLSGTVKKGITIAGVNLDVGLTGNLLGASAEVGVESRDTCIEGEIGAGLGAGLGLKASIDWSGLDLPDMSDLAGLTDLL